MFRIARNWWIRRRVAKLRARRRLVMRAFSEYRANSHDLLFEISKYDTEIFKLEGLIQ